MDTNKIVKEIEKIISLIEKYNEANPQHSDSCEFLRNKYSSFKEALIHNKPEVKEYIEWNKWFAPRIIFDGINDKDILNGVEALNK